MINHIRRTVDASVAALYIIILLSLASCSSNGKKYCIGMSQCSEDIWRNWQNQELRMEANFHDGVELRFAAALDDSKRQTEQIDSLVESGIDLLIVAPNQLQSVSPAIDRAYDRGIPVIVFERKTDSQKYTAFVSADNYEMGRQMGEYIANRLKGKGSVLEILGLKGSSPADERHKGFHDAISSFPQIEVVASLQGDWTEETAYKAVKQWLEKGEKVDFVFGHNDRTAIGARRAMSERMGKEQLPLFCGIDGLPGENGGIRLVRDSLLDASYIYPTRGDQLLQLALDILDGKPYEKEIMLTSALVTQDNANVLLLESDEVMRQSEKLAKLQDKASTYLQQLDSQRIINLLVIGIALLLLLLMAGTWLYNRQRARLAEERGKMEREQLDFYTQVSHELRTPLTLIEGPLSQLAKTPEMQQATPATASTLDIVRRNTSQLSELINKMLDVQVKGSISEDAVIKMDEEMMQPKTEPKALAADETTNAEPKSVLIVDDNGDIRTYLRSILQDSYQLLEAEDGQKGLDIAREQVPDLIVSDVMMPVMNGLEFCQHVKSDMVTSHIPVILLTARALSRHQIEGYESGADAYITKPFQPDVLMARITNLLRSRRVLKNLWSAPATSQAEPTPDPEDPFIQRFKNVVGLRMADSDLSVEDIGSELGLSRVQLYRKVKALTGNTPVDLLRKARLASAMEELQQGHLSVSEIAYKVGFASPSYFTKCFKDEYGMVPGEVRKAQREQE